MLQPAAPMNKRRSKTPTQRSLALLQNEGFPAAVVEWRLPRCMMTEDAFGLFDLMAVRADFPGVLGIPTTSGMNHASRVKKLLSNARLQIWLAAGNTAEVWPWAKRQGRWTCRQQRLVAADLDGADADEMTGGDSA